jgi:hypothetical protein
MRNSPLNYILALAVAGVLVAIAAVFAGDTLSESLDLGDRTVEEFLQIWRWILVAAGVFGLLATWYWFYYGSRPSAATDITGAIRMWNILFVVEILLATTVSVVLVFLFQGTFSSYALFMSLSACLTVVSFWVYTLLWSPSNVMYVPLGRR